MSTGSLTHTVVSSASLGRDFAPLRRYVEVVRVLAARNLKSRYRGSILGIYWSLCNPLIMTGIYAALFGTAFSQYYNGNVWNYVLACFAALAVLNFFAGSTTQALPSLVANGGLLNKLQLPLSAFPISVVVANLFQFVVGVFPLLAIVTVCVTHDLTHVLWLIVPTISLIMLSTGFSLLVATLFVYFRDLSYLYELVIFVLWISSPVFYPADLVPAHLRTFIAFNPLATLMASVRGIALDPGRPHLHLLATSLVSSAIALLIGAGVFRWQQRSFMDLI